MNRYERSVLFKRSLYLDYFEDGFVGLFLFILNSDSYRTRLFKTKSEAVLKLQFLIHVVKGFHETLSNFVKLV